MKLNKFKGSAYLETNDHRILFGCPPEIHKALMKEKLRFPDIIVCSDLIAKNGTTLYSPEFIIMAYLFIDGNINFADMTIKKIKILGTQEQINRFKEILRITFLGPTKEEYDMWGIDKKTSEMLLCESEYFCLKNKNGFLYNKIEDYIEECCFDSNEAYKFKDNLIIKKSAQNEFIVENGENKTEINIDFEGKIEPVWESIEVFDTEHANRFSLRIIGAASGFNYQAPSTTYLLSLNNQFYLWDCAPYCSRVLRLRKGLPPNQITGIIISHIHDDHCSDLIPFAYSSPRKIDIVTTEVIWNMLLVKISNMMGISIQEVTNCFNWIKVDIDKKMQLNGALFKWHYGVHSIPSIGATITFKGKVIIISGDTGSKSVLDKMLKTNKISNERHEALADILKGSTTSFVDCGEALIHGTPDDFKDVQASHEIIFSHRSNIPEGFSGFNLAEPGKLFVFRESDPSELDGVLLERMLLKAGVSDSKWGEIFTLEKISMVFSSGEVILAENSKDTDFFYVLSHGIIEILKNKKQIAVLEKGDYFGHQAIINDSEYQKTSYVAVTPVRILVIRGRIFKEMFESETRKKSCLMFKNIE